ncbi:TIM barrel protein [Desulfosediminicola sp.]|uniref:TIM barrel protein n=1 Tax=Desulfosediminicola sp. TaxID=2886825 RepID=UPI003AF2711D
MSHATLLNGNLHDVVLAVSAHFHSFPRKPEWITAHDFAMEYSPNPSDLSAIPHHVAPYLRKGVAIRHHAYFPQYEIADRDQHLAERATKLHLSHLEAIKGIGEQHVTVHIGLTPEKTIDQERAVSNLARIVEHASNLGISVALENLKHGVTSDPETVVDWSRRSGAGITLDVGHAVSCEGVRNGDFSVLDIVGMFEGNLQEVHLYESETDTHHAPQDMTILGDIVDRLLETDCRWWTIELDSPEEVETTRSLVMDHYLLNSPYLKN